MKLSILTKLDAEIVRRNFVFTHATKARRRVLLAQDVLAQLNAKTIMAETGVWADAYEFGDKAPSESLQKAMLAKEVTCECCALGSLMLSCVLFKNKVKTNAALNGLDFGDGKAASMVKALFTLRQLELIECFFEGGNGGLDYYKLTPNEFATAKNFADNHDNDKRLRLIMANIIKNKGTFKPRIKRRKVSYDIW